MPAPPDTGDEELRPEWHPARNTTPRMAEKMSWRITDQFTTGPASGCGRRFDFLDVLVLALSVLPTNSFRAPSAFIQNKNAATKMLCIAPVYSGPGRSLARRRPDTRSAPRALALRRVRSMKRAQREMHQ